MGYKNFSNNLDECDCIIFSYKNDISPEEITRLIELSYEIKLNGQGSILVGIEKDNY